MSLELGKVLVVDDEAAIRRLLRNTLQVNDYRVFEAGTVAEALALSASHQPDVILLDLGLPDGDGLDLVRHIAGLAADLPVAVITAYGSAENAVAALKAGAFDYVAKPVALEQLRALVRAALAYITLAKDGVSETELNHLLSLDDDVLASV